jgi:hypothetical protein
MPAFTWSGTGQQRYDYFKELGINSNTSSNTTYNPTSFDKDEILANHRSCMTSLNIPSGKESEGLPYLYWIPNLHKTPYKKRYIAGSSTCSTKELSIHLTKNLSTVKEGQQKYCETVYSRSGIRKLCELLLLRGFLICHAVGWYIELKNQKFWWRIPERKILISGYPKDI